MRSDKHAVPAVTVVSALAASAAIPAALGGTVAPAVPVPGHLEQATLDAHVVRTLPVPRPLALRVTSVSQQKSYTVVAGDTLAGIAGRFCGSTGKWPALNRGNHAEIADPDRIYPGQKIRLTCNDSYLIPAASAAPSPAPVAADITPGQAAPVASASVTGITGGTLSFAGLEALWAAAGGPASAEYAAAKVAECESAGNQYAYNPSGASGYWQILGQVVPGNVFDPLVNAENAVAKFTASGDTWAQWVCQP